MPRRLSLQLVAALALVSSTAPGLQGQALTGTVTGRVTEPGGAPIFGASVLIVGTQSGSLTRSDGTYRVALRPGRYEIRARLVGYTLGRDSITITAGGSVTRDFTLEKSATTLNAIAVVGSRTEERTVLDAPAPIDVLTASELRATGRVEVAQMIQMVAPSFNFPRATIGDGTDHTRPATLRGLGADQVLVLVNGKRRHSSSLVNVNGTIGRGQAAVDLNAIPANMIDRIEILRDGASAQYGSDAIAGVINLILKSNAPAEASVTAGRTQTTLEGNPTLPAATQGFREQLTDGEVLQATGNYGWDFGGAGFLAVGAEFRDRGATNRSLPDTRQQYFNNDPRNANPPAVNHRQGDADTRDIVGFFNYGRNIGDGTRQVYSFGGVSKREGEAAGFFRRAQDDRTIRAPGFYPDGFLPLIASDIWDYSGTVGMKGELGGWDYDLSTVGGRNTFGFIIRNSANVTLGTASPREFDSGRLGFTQSTTNIDFNRGFDIGLPNELRFATGAEFRYESYDITAGEPDSYRDGGVAILDGPNAGRQGALGAQVFPGFRPTDAGAHGRSNVGLWVEAENDLTNRWLVSVALRGENYSDFGTTGTGKLATRFSLLDQLKLRGAVSTGFRAPSLHQQWFSSTATNFINGAPFDVRTLPVTDPIARALGAVDLEPERSVNWSGGFAVEPTRNLSFTADYYNIFIADRVVFSENFTGAQVTALLNSRGLTGVSGGRFFTNAINTRTQGADFVANFGTGLGTLGFLRLTGAYNVTENRVTHVKATPAELSSQSEALFGRVEKGRIELGQPRSNIVASANLTRSWFGLTLRAQRFGEVVSLGTAANGSLDNTFGAKVITDISAEARLANRFRLTVGADNLLDVYPDVNSAATNNAGIFPYNGISPFGFNGRFVYVRLNITP
jgi:iron complex outermembrane receptor protein